MKYTLEIEIDLPRAKVIDLFDSIDNLYKWQPGLISFDHVSGVPGEVGAKSRLKYKIGKREMEMIETVTVKKMPEEFSGYYETKGMRNDIVNKFEEISPTKTRWISHNEFKGSGIMMKSMLFLMPGVFKKESFKYLKNFKKFAESEVSSN